jgi:copper(I)-binding protein
VSRPQLRKAVRPRLIPAVLGFGAVIAVAGCSAGQVTQTNSQVAAVNGDSGTVRNIGVQDAQLTFPTGRPFYPAGASAPLQAILVNNGTQGDRLVKVSSPYAASAQISGDTDLPGDTALNAYGIPPASSEQPTSPGGAAPTSSTAPASSTAPTSSTVPTSGTTSPAAPHTVDITLTGLTQQIGPGVTIPVTFVFQQAGPVTVQVPIGADKMPRPNQSNLG